MSLQNENIKNEAESNTDFETKEQSPQPAKPASECDTVSSFSKTPLNSNLSTTDYGIQKINSQNSSETVYASSFSINIDDLQNPKQSLTKLNTQNSLVSSSQSYKMPLSESRGESFTSVRANKQKATRKTLYLMKHNKQAPRLTVNPERGGHSLVKKPENIDPSYEPFMKRKNNLHFQSYSEFKQVMEKYDSVVGRDYDMKRELESKLQTIEMKKKKQQENRYKRWTNQVYNPLMNKLQENTKNIPFETVQLRKHEIYKRYLEYVNKKGCAFLDIVDPEEYSLYSYPYPVSPEKVKVNVSRDPLKYSLQLQDEEMQVSMCLLTGKFYNRDDVKNLKQFSQHVDSMSREQIDAAKWLLIPENNILSTPRAISMRRIHPGRFNRSVLNESILDKYRIAENQKNASSSLQKNSQLEKV